MERLPRTLRIRRGYVHLVLLLAFLGLAVRLAWVQCYQHDWLAQKAEAMEEDTIVLEAQRGLILSRDGYSLAVTTRAPSVYVNPRAVPADQRRSVADTLAKLLKTDAERIAETLEKPRYFAWVERKVTPAEADAVMKAKLPGVGLRDETRRQYPGGSLLCQVLGYVGLDGQGLEGLEGEYNGLLAGTNGEEEVFKDGKGRSMGAADAPLKAPIHGRSLILTIDSRVQRIVEEELADACAHHRPDAACAVVMDPWTGDVLALANWPTFDPARYGDVPQSVRKNTAVCECLEPGSTFKPFVASAALDAGVVTPETIFDCHQGVLRIGARTLHDAHGYGRLTVREIIAYSSNIGMAQVGERLGADRIYQALVGFGFGRKTGIELPGESAGLLHPPRAWSKLTISSIPMGQEVACSPLQLTAGFCVFANGGWHVKPRLLLGIGDKDGRLEQRLPDPAFYRVLTPKTADLMRGDLLAGVVEYGTARACAIDGYTMAGKTGTAQLARPDARGYESGAYSAAFVGMAPVDQPRVVVGVILKKPKGGSYYGGVVSAPAVAKMTERILSTYGVARAARPDEEPDHARTVAAHTAPHNGH